jgi:aminopeptidase N
MRMKQWIAAVFVCGGWCGAAYGQQQAAKPQAGQTQQTAPKDQPGTGQSAADQSPTSQTEDQPSNPNAKVIFSRSDEDAAPAKQDAAVKPGTIKATDDERAAVTFTAYDFDIHLAPREHTLAVRVRLDVRNDGDQPLKVIPLQISSSLHWEGVSLDGKRLPMGLAIVNSDVDHTGQLNEAAVELPTPLAPKNTLRLEATYSGPVEIDAKRLLQLGTPDDVAERSDWDRISEDFTGLRGFGNVVWYPVSSVPALLGDQAKVFAEIGTQKLRQSDAMVAMRVSVEFYGAEPSLAILNGHVVEMEKPTAMPTNEYPGVVACSLPATKLGFAVPTLFVGSRTVHEGSGVRVYVREENAANAQGVMTAATMVRPLVEQWLGSKPRSPLTVVDLPEVDDAAYEQGGVLFIGLASDPPEKLAETLAHALAHTYFQSPREWLNEGVASFIGTLWIERMHNREMALEKLEASRSALAFAEPESPGAGPGQDLLHASDAIYYRTKATYVLWMLRDMAGDKPLATSLQAYNPADDTSADYFEHLVEQASGKDLKWFFDDWVYRDRGLPDLSIAKVNSSTAAHEGQYLVAVDILNDGFAETEVPVTVRSHDSTLTERVRLPGKTRTAHRMLIQGEPVEVIVNDGTVPEVQAGIHKRTLTNAN